MPRKTHPERESRRRARLAARKRHPSHEGEWSYPLVVDVTYWVPYGQPCPLCLAEGIPHPDLYTDHDHDQQGRAGAGNADPSETTPEASEGVHGKRS